MYITSLFGSPPALPKKKKYIKLTQNLKSELDTHENLGSKSPVEQFYRRHIIQTHDNPIPQILIVGILRILLTTCPTANRTSGGIDLQREWVSSVRLALKYPELITMINQDKSAEFSNNIIKEPLKTLTKKLDKSEDKSDKDEDEKENNDDDSNSEEDVGNPETIDLAVVDFYKYENNRHSLITAKFIGLLLLFIQRHFHSNHVLQCVYLSSLIVDANGVLVLLKFINQDFSLIDNKNLRRSDVLSIICCDLDPALKSQNTADSLVMDEDMSKNQKMENLNKYIIEDTISPLLQLMYRVTVGQSERIRNILIQYKAVNIMKRIATNFKEISIKTVAYKIIMIQIKYMDKAWKKDSKSFKIISQVYDNVGKETQFMIVFTL